MANKPGFQSQQSTPLVYVVTVNWNRVADTLDCLSSIYNSTYSNLRVLVVDNGSSDGSPEKITQGFPMVEQIINPENLGFARGYNIGMKHAVDSGAEYVFIINNDATVAPDAITHLVQSSSPKNGILAPLVKYAEHPNMIWSSGGLTRSWTLEKHDPLYEKQDTGDWDHTLSRDFVTGCAMLLPSTTLTNVGYFDENFHMYYEDMDLCRRVRNAGLEIFVIPSAKVWHKIARSSGGLDTPNERYWMARSSVRFFRKHAESIQKPVIIFWRSLSALRTSIRLLTNNRSDALKAYWSGLRDGLREKI
jgi:GT2 family glycosyltransferase